MSQLIRSYRVNSPQKPLKLLFETMFNLVVGEVLYSRSVLQSGADVFSKLFHTKHSNH